MKIIGRKSCFISGLLLSLQLVLPGVSSAESKAKAPTPTPPSTEVAGNATVGAAFKVYGSTKSYADIMKEDPSTFFDIEKRKYDLIEEMAKESFLKKYWENLGKEQKISAEKAEEKYLQGKVKTQESEVKETLERFKTHPQLSKLPKDEQEKQVREYLRERDKKALLDAIVEQGFKSGDVQVLYPKPQEPLYSLTVSSTTDHVRYGPAETDTKPMGCAGEACQVTVVEYSEYQCPFCSRVLDDTKKILESYKGKIRWIVRDFPLDFHPRAIPAAIAAKCSSFQGKYWEMYYKLFSDQKNLNDSDFEKHASQIKLNMADFKKCYAQPDKAKKIIQANFESGRKLGVSGTPAFFINGRKFAGALPYSEFKKVIDEELVKTKS